MSLFLRPGRRANLPQAWAGAGLAITPGPDLIDCDRMRFAQAPL